MAAPLAAPAADFTVTAIVAAYNEEDVIGQVVADLVRQGVQVYLIDDGSTDGTVARVEPWVGRGVLAIERRPPGATSSWAELLRRKEELAAQLDADWFLHHDADELRESPWRELTLSAAIARVDRLGYDAIDFAVLDFWPTGEGWQPGADLRASFTHYTPGRPLDKLQVKAWRKTAAVELVSSGGHEARFAGRRVFPLRFLLRHYPVRSQAHGERKVFAERLPRLGAEGRARGWHRQYEGLAPGSSFVRRPEELIAYDDDAVRLELLLRHRGVEQLEQALAAAGGDPDLPYARLGEVESQLAGERERSERLSRELDARNREAARLAAELDARNREAARLASELDAQNQQLQQLATETERLRARLAAVLDSRSWRWTAPLRRALRAVGLG